MDREELEGRWLSLTKEAMPAAAGAKGWPVRFDHCFQRILLDNAAGRCWYEVVERRPAYRHAPRALLARALELGEAALDGRVDLGALNQESLRMRGKAGPR